jgi:hypothetical protein
VQHIIKKQIIQLELSSKDDAFRIQHLVSEYYWKEIIPVLQKVFDSISRQGETIRMDQLEIDLGTISIKDLEQGKWASRLELILREQLTGMLSQVHSNMTVQRESSPSGIFRQWMYYMENGYLPWNVLQVDEAWYEKTLQTLATDFKSVSELRKKIRTNSLFLDRIISQHPDSFLVSLVETLTAEKQENIPGVIDELYEAFYFIDKTTQAEKSPVTLPTNNKRDFIKTVWKIVLQVGSANEKHVSTEILTEMILSAHITEPGTIKSIKRALASKLVITKPILSRLQLKLTELQKEYKDDPGKTHPVPNETYTQSPDHKNDIPEKLSDSKSPLKDKDKEHEEKNRRQDTIGEKSDLIHQKRETANAGHTVKQEKSNTEPDRDHDDNVKDEISRLQTRINNFSTGQNNKERSAIDNYIDEEGVFVRHAGIVLLHPFLGSFFKRLQLTSEKTFPDLLTHQKALHLLHFLGTGNIHPNEYELVIAKILCAYPLQQPVEMDIEIGEWEMDEANDLLNAAIAQWDVLKNSSAAALREGFLQRNGKLFIKNDKRYLQVEKSAIDVLIDRLPWNLSMIKLPWMNEMLRVEWR